MRRRPPLSAYHQWSVTRPRQPGPVLGAAVGWKGVWSLDAIVSSTLLYACHFSSSGTCIFNQQNYHATTSGTHVEFIVENSYVFEMQLWFVTVSSNELDQCALWDTTRRLDSVHEQRYLIKSWQWWYWCNTDLFGVKAEDWRLLLSTLIVRYKCCENVVVFLAFRYVALALALAVGLWPWPWPCGLWPC